MKGKRMALLLAAAVFASSVQGSVLISSAEDEMILEDTPEITVEEPEYSGEDLIITEDAETVDDSMQEEDGSDTDAQEEAGITIEDISVVEEDEIPEELRDTDYSEQNENLGTDDLALSQNSSGITGIPASINEHIDNSIALMSDDEKFSVDITVTYQQSAARSMLDLVNEFRTSGEGWYWDEDNNNKIECGVLPEFVYDYTLEEIAMKRAAEIALFYNSSHNRPNGDACWTAYDEYGYYYFAAAENIAAGQNSVEAAFDAWKEENAKYSGQGHRRHMLSDTYTSIGIACVYYNGEYYWVQEFAYPTYSSTETSANDGETEVSIDFVASNIKKLTVTPSYESCEMFVGDSKELPTLTTELSLNSGYSEAKASTVDVDYSWEIEDSNCVEISGNQLIAKSVGTTSLKTVIFTDDIEIPVTVTQDITSCTMSLASDEFTYDGTEQEPAVSVADGSTILTEGTDFTVTYENNTNAGTATVTVTGMGSYSGTASLEFTINPASIAEADVAFSEDSFTYDGNEQVPEVTVTVGSAELANGTDYTLVYEDNINAGTAKVTVTGQGNYTGETTASFTIEAASIAEAQVMLSENSFTYDGSAKEPEVTVTMADDIVLTVGTDYTVSYTDNINVGTATVTVTGQGNYTASAMVKFTIGEANLSEATVTLSEDSFTYDGEAKTPDVTVVTVDGKELAEGTDYTVDYADNTDVGTATVTVSGTGNYGGTLTAEFTIEAASIKAAEVTLSEDSFTYDGEAKTPDVTVVTVDGKELAEGTEYTVNYADNTDVGTATVTVSGTGNYGGTLTAEFTIEAASIEAAEVTLSEDSFTYDGEAKTPDVTVVTADGKELVEGTEYTVDYADNTDAGTATVTVGGTGNYSGTLTVEFTIEAANIEEAEITFSEDSCTYDGNEKVPEVTVTVGSAELANGTDYTVKYEDNVNAGTATVTVTGQGNYTGETTASFTIEAASIADAEITLSEDSFTYDAEAKTPDVTAVIVDGKELVAGTDYSVEYTDNTNAGTATVTVTGEGNYTGTASAAFMIEPITLDSEDTEVEFSAGDFTYDGTAQTPEIKVTLKDGTELEEGVDYELSYGDNGNINVGEVTVTITGIGNYSGEIAGAVTFEIAAKDIAGAEVTIPNVTHTGEAQEPDMTVVVDGRTLTAGTDYTVEYENNTDVGTANVTITGTGNYTGTAYAEFEIEEEQTETEKQTGGTTTGSGTTSGTTGSGTTGSGTTGSGTTGSTTTTLKKGSKYTVGKFVYKITKLPASGTGEVTLTRPAKSSIASASIPAKVTIGNRSFKVTKIAAGAFKGCTKLKTVAIGKNVATIGNQAFASCTKMTAVTIKTGTTTIGKKAFYNCKKLKTITIKSKKLTSVGKNAFKGIKSNAKIVVPKSKYKAYTKLLAGKGQGAKVKITK